MVPTPERGKQGCFLLTNTTITTRFFFNVCLLFLMGSTGCQPAPPPAPPDAPEPNGPEVSVEPPDTSNRSAPTAPASVLAPKYSAEQMAAAKQLAADLAVVIREDAAGNITLLDTAAKRSWVDDYQMQELLVFPTLQTLTVKGPSISEQLAPKIAEAEALTTLNMRNTLINDQGIAQLSGLKALRVIDLRLSPLVTDAAMETLAAMPELRAVRLSGVNVTDAGLAKLLELPRLMELDLRNCRKITKEGIAQAGAKKTLRMLKIGGPEIDDPVLDLVTQMGELTGLSLDGCNISDAGVAQLDRLPLDDLTIFQCANITDEGLNVLAAYDRMRRLTLRGVAARGAALEKLPQPNLLVTLNLEQSGITDAEVPVLARFTKLESLNLSQTRLTDEAIEGLAKLTWLKDLTLTQTNFTNEGAQRLREALPDVSIRFH